MASIPSIHRQFLDEFGNRERMLAIRFGGRRPDIRPPPCSFLVQRVDIAEAVSTPLHAVVHGITPDVWEIPYDKVTGDHQIEAGPDQFIGLPAGLIVRAEGVTRTFHGVVTGARHLGSWHAHAERRGYQAVELTIESPLRLFDLRRANRLFLERSTMQILNELLGEHRARNEVVEETLRAEFPDERDRPDLARACRTQYQETDLDFIHRLLIDEGLSYVIRSEKGENGAGNLWEVFGAGYNFGSEPYAILSPAPLPGEVTLLRWHSQRRLVPGCTTARSHDYRSDATFEGAAEGRRNSGMGELARGVFGSHETLPPRAVVEPANQLSRSARHRQWAHDMDAEVFAGESSAPLSLVRSFRVRGLSNTRLSQTSEHDDFIVTSQRIVATASIAPGFGALLGALADEAATRVRAGTVLPGNDVVPGSLRVTFEAQPAEKPLVPRHPRFASRPMPGPVTATVSGREGSVVETDEFGRIAVVFHWERPRDVSDVARRLPSFPDGPPVRIRYVHPGAGDAMGMQHLPRVGDEVLIIFIDNDVDRPIAVGSVHNSQRRPPAFGGVAGLPRDAALTGWRTGEHKGTGASELVFDDTTGQVGVRLASTTVSTGLSLGQISTPRQSGGATLRGLGAELRTDGAAALRAAHGMLISTVAAGREAQHLHHAGLTDLLDRCHELTQALGSAIAQTGASAPAASGQATAREALASWTTHAQGQLHGGAAVVAIHGQDGIVAATPASQVLYAGQEMHVVSDGAAQVTSGAALHVVSARQLSLFAEDDGIDVVADGGNVHVQSRQQDVVAEARRDVHVTATEGRVLITGLEVEIRSHDGSYLRIGNGIECGTAKNVVVHGAHISLERPDTRETQRHAADGHTTDQRFHVRYTNDPEGYNDAGAMALRVIAEGGQEHASTTAADGLTETVSDTVTRALRAHVLDKLL